MVHDIIGIGIGPFNLGLAALAEGTGLNCKFFDQGEGFSWHPGMLLPEAKLQVPFYADLVTLADPTSRFSFLNFLKQNNRLFRFAIHENNFVSRKLYNAYCNWVADQLDNLCFHHRVIDLHFNEADGTYTVVVLNLSSNHVLEFTTRYVVIGIGSAPWIPEFIPSHPSIIHSSEYLFHKDRLVEKGDVTVIGSGQSAAEIFYDLLQCSVPRLNWFTRSERFFPMEYNRLSLEMTSPDYIDHFYSLGADQKKSVLAGQDMLYKGINYSLINDIYDQLYHDNLMDCSCDVGIMANAELQGVTAVDGRLRLGFYHRECERHFDHVTGAIVMATGYRSVVPCFLETISSRVKRLDNGSLDVARNYSVDVSSQIFVQNAEVHSHGFNAADLGMGPYRNAVILNQILGFEHFGMERNVAFQRFGVPK